MERKKNIKKKICMQKKNWISGAALVASAAAPAGAPRPAAAGPAARAARPAAHGACWIRAGRTAARTASLVVRAGMPSLAARSSSVAETEGTGAGERARPAGSSPGSSTGRAKAV